MKINEYINDGLFLSHHSNYYYYMSEESLLCEDAEAELSKIETEARNDQGIANDIIESYVLHVTLGLSTKRDKHLISTALFGCMYIEGLLNHYGTRRIGEQFYMANIERMRPVEKASIIFEICCEIEISDTLKKLIKNISEFRNSLVHPKTKNVKFNDTGMIQDKILTYISVSDILHDVNLITDELCRMDPSMSKEVISDKRTIR